MIGGYKIIKKTKGWKSYEADLWSGKDIIDADEREWLAKEEEERRTGKKGDWLYRHTVGYVF